MVTDHVAAGLVEDYRVVGEIRRQIDDLQGGNAIQDMPAEEIVRMLAAEAAALADGQPVKEIGIAFPGIVRAGIIEDSPNLPQIKGLNVAAARKRSPKRES